MSWRDELPEPKWDLLPEDEHEAAHHAFAIANAVGYLMPRRDADLPMAERLKAATETLNTIVEVILTTTLAGARGWDGSTALRALLTLQADDGQDEAVNHGHDTGASLYSVWKPGLAEDGHEPLDVAPNAEDLRFAIAVAAGIGSSYGYRLRLMTRAQADALARARAPEGRRQGPHRRRPGGGRR